MEIICLALAVGVGPPVMFTALVLLTLVSQEPEAVRDRRLPFLPRRGPDPRDEAARERWLAAAETLGLQQVGGHFYRLVGEIDGVPVKVEGTGDLRTPRLLGLTVRATLPAPLPSETRVVHHATPPERAVRLEDPILDTMVAVSCRDPAAVRERLCLDEVRGPLLDVVHAHPGSILRSTAVELVVAREAGDPAPLIRKAVDLANAVCTVPTPSRVA